MSFNVKHLNADTTFLLSFAAQNPPAPGSNFTILLDPWLAGSSSIWNPRFQISHHTSEPIVTSIAHLPLPNIILISQDKPDHCHEETLKTLPADTPVHIVAVPAAVKRIKSWRYFTHATITALRPHNSKNPDSVLRIPLKSSDSLFGVSGELTLAYIPQKYDVTNLHNAIGITYLPPTSAAPLDANGLPIALPPSPPMTPIRTSTVDRPTESTLSLPISPSSNLFPDAPTSISGPSTTTQRPLSVLYTPHGIGIPCITPFMNSHLRSLNALPLTALFHSINVEQNPWFLGGLVASGFPGGLALVKNFGARYWLSAHDEAKDNRGWSVAMLKSRLYSMHEARILLESELEHGNIAAHGEGLELARSAGPTKLVDLDVGEGLTIGIDD